MSHDVFVRAPLVRAARYSTLAVVIITMACGKDAAPSSQTGAPAASAGVAGKKPCEYMARGDAEAAIELPLPNTTENVPLGMCDYMTAEFYGASLTVTDWVGIKNAANGAAGTKAPTAVAGVGDEALTRGGGGALYVRKGTSGFLLTLNGPVVDHLPDRGLAKAKTLALKILPNL
jgi:hypothetical protein